MIRQGRSYSKAVRNIMGMDSVLIRKRCLK